MRHLYAKVVPPEHKRFWLPRLILLEIVRSDVDHLLLKPVDKTGIDPLLELKVVVGEHQRQLTGAVALIEQVDEVFEGQIWKLFLNVFKTSVMIDHYNHLVCFTHIGDVLCRC